MAAAGEAGHRAGLGDPLLEHLAVARLAVAQDQVRVDRLVALAERGVDADLLEQRVQPNVRASSGMIGTIRWPELGSRIRLRRSRAKTIVVLTAVALPGGELGVDLPARRR